MGKPPPAPQGDAVPSSGAPSPQPHSVADFQPSTGAPKKNGSKGKRIGIILGGVLGVAAIAAVLWFFVFNKGPTEPSITLADYVKGKRFTYMLPKDAVPEGLPPQIAQMLSSQPVFIQFETNNVSQFGTTIQGRVVAMEKGTYSTEGLNLVIAKDGGNDTVVFTKADPGEGDEVVLTDAKGKQINLTIAKVEPAAPLQSAGGAMLGALGLGGDGGLGGMGALAGMLPGKGGGEGRPGKPKPKPGYQQQSGAGGAQGKPSRPGRPGGGGAQMKRGEGRTQQWTYGVGRKDLSNWKGKVNSQQVLYLFGNPDEGKPWGQDGGAWTYKNMKIKDAAGKSHASVTFYVQNGQVVDIKLPSATGQPPGGN